MPAPRELPVSRNERQEPFAIEFTEGRGVAQRGQAFFMVPTYIRGGNTSIDSPAGPTGLLGYDFKQPNKQSSKQINKQTNKQINKSLDNKRASGAAHMAEGVFLCFYLRGSSLYKYV